MAIGFIYGGLAALQLAGGYYKAENIKNTAALNNDIAQMNAEFAELDAYDAKIEGFSEQATYQGIVDATLSTQRAEIAAADVDVNFGTAGTIQDETRFIAELNKMQIEKSAQEKSLGFEREGRNYRLSSYLDSLQSAGQVAATRISAVTGAAKTGLTGYRRSR